MAGDHVRQAQRGWVSLETAFGAIAIVVVVLAAGGLLHAGATQVACHDRAAAIVRQLARDDQAMADQLIDDLPTDWQIQSRRDGQQLSVTVGTRVAILGPWLPQLSVEASASAVVEEGL
ncbi:MAG: hypothetical protein LBV30_06470 [Propionibacteriaceae bacterium]|nr:hypothetical protein [Propionibacteriaceae bacterium]